MSPNEEQQSCLHCGKPLGTKAVQGLCPACLLKVGLGSIEGDETQPARFEAPAPEDLAALFPQLEILELIGTGGMGAVYKARQPELNRWVALKVLAPKGKDDPSFAERFAREARALAHLSHPNIVAVHDFGHREDLYFFVMEYVDGTNLRQVMRAGTLSPKEALAIVPQICTALQFAHDEGVVHRDIKPENILLDAKGRVKIADYGLAKMLGREQVNVTLTQEGHVMGTPHYMAPEQVEHPKDVDHRADIYSLGVVFYEMLTGELPLGKFAPPSRKVQVDVRLDEVVLKTLEKEPLRRYQRVGQVGTEVETIALGRAEGGSRKGKSRRWIKSVVAFVGVAILISIAIFWVPQLYFVRVALDPNAPIPDAQPHQLRGMSTADVIRAGLAHIDKPWAWSEIKSRAHAGDLSATEAQAIVKGLTAWLQEDYPDGYDRPLSWVGSMLETLDDCGLLAEETLLKLMQALHGSVKVRDIPRLREGEFESISIDCEWVSTWHKRFLGYTLLNEMAGINLDGRPVAVDSLMQSYHAPTAYHGSIHLPSLSVGKHVLEGKVTSAVVATVDTVGLRDSVTSQDWPPAKKVWTRPWRVEFSVFGAEEGLVRFTEEPALNPMLAQGIVVNRIIVRSYGEKTQAAVSFLVNPLPVSVSFSVFLRLEENTIAVGSFWHEGISEERDNPSHSAPVLSEDIPSIKAYTKRADVILKPNPKPIERRPHVDRIWGKEIVFRDVPLTRHDLASGGGDNK